MEFQQIKGYQRFLKVQHNNIIDHLRNAQYHENKNDVNYDILNKKYLNFQQMQE
jgi:hypothetical protein